MDSKNAQNCIKNGSKVRIFGIVYTIKELILWHNGVEFQLSVGAIDGFNSKIVARLEDVEEIN